MHGTGAKPVAVVGACGATRTRFLVEAEIENGILRWKSARLISPEHAQQLEANLGMGIPEHVTIADGGFVCPVCSGPTVEVEFAQCMGCKVFHCLGRAEGGVVLGACGSCRFGVEQYVYGRPFCVNASARY